LATLRIRVVAEERPVPGVRIYRQLPGGWEAVGATDRDGVQTWKVDPAIFPLTLVLKPASGYWDRYVRFEHADLEAAVSLEPLAWTGPLGWWHACMGPAAGRDGAGAGIRVGVVDTGFGPSDCLDHVTGVGAWIDGVSLPGTEAARDVSNHGTHVTGLLAARPCSRTTYAGMAPAVSAFVVRVFSDASWAGADDIASAIEQLVEEHEVHLINLSVGDSGESSEDERATIRYAFDHGALVVAAAGNDGGAIHYPAAYAEPVAVGAVGRTGEGSAFAREGGYRTDRAPAVSDEGLYAAEFSSHGPGLSCVAPGVDLISTVPASPDEKGSPLAGMCGTSQAAPVACGALAILLARDPEYMSMEPSRLRSEKARRILVQSCRDLGFEPDRQGVGLPTVP
jgi:subtilisin